MKKVFIYGDVGIYGNYVRALETSGAEAVASRRIETSDSCDALLLPGGGDVSPCLYGSAYPHPRCVDIKRDVTEQYLIAKFMRRRLPILGVCRGMQILNVYFGGTLEDHMENAEKHIGADGDLYHAVKCEKNSFMEKVFGQSLIANSAHHQCVKICGKGISVCARAFGTDPEALEHSSGKVIAVQFHPERMDKSAADRLYGYFLSL